MLEGGLRTGEIASCQTLAFVNQFLYPPLAGRLPGSLVRIKLEAGVKVLGLLKEFFGGFLATARDEELALLRYKAVEENSDFLWRQILDQAKFLVDKYNSTFSSQVNLADRTGCPSSGFDVYRQVHPIVTLAVRRNSKHFIEFSIDRTEAWKATKSVNGRIDLKADNNRNVYMIVDGQTKTPAEVADYLLEPVFM